MEHPPPVSPALDLLMEAWSWRELDAARCRTALEAARTAHLAAGTFGQPESGDTFRLTSAALQVVWGYLCFREVRLAEALECAEEALGLLVGHPESCWSSRVLNVKSCAQLELGELELATLTLREQLRVSRANGDAETEGATLHDLGVMHTQRDPAHAEGYLDAAWAVFEKTGHPVGRSYVSWSLGELRERQGRTAEATVLYRRALTLSRACGHLFLEVLVLSRLGELELQHGDPLAGEQWLREALTRQSADPSRPLWITVPPLVRLLIFTGRMQEARTVLEAQLAGAMAAGMVPPQVQIYELLSEVLDALGEPGVALEHLREHNRLFREQNAQEQAQKVRGLEVLHRTELAQQEAWALRQRNEELRSALEELERLHRQLEQISVTDELTGVKNRHHLMTRGVGLLEAQFRSAQSEPQPHSAHVAVAILDIDHFKAVNDTYGHDGGDRVLRSFAQFLKSGLREGDELSRFGGEEFVILFPDTPLDEAYRLLDGLRLGLRSFSFEGLPPGFRVAFTAGIVNCPNADLMDALRRADQLLYRGKRSGRDAVTREKLDGWPVLGSLQF
ncbi:diguanylate cyclase [Deinococcus altitudinis]|uniref:tetratricopeptide repeat-containing diguanylate cyclase n=1 Tax=Deinococcus altitudinis TaxID=468914 RepID=UPI003892C30F